MGIGSTRTKGRDAKKKTRMRKEVETPVRKKSHHLEGVKDIDVRDIDFLRRFVTDHGKIIPARYSGATAKQQRLIQTGIRRARTMGLLP